MAIRSNLTAPDRIAAAMAAVDVTTTPFHLGIAQNAWADLKEASGQTVNFSRLTPCHLIEAPCPPSLVTHLVQRGMAARAVVRQIAIEKGHRTPPPGGAA